MFLHVFYARFYSDLSFYIQLLIHSYPLSTVLSLDLIRSQPFSVWNLSVLNRSQSGPYIRCLNICSVLHHMTALIHLLKCQGQRFFKVKSKPCLNSQTKKDLLRDREIQSSYKSHLP